MNKFEKRYHHTNDHDHEISSHHSLHSHNDEDKEEKTLRVLLAHWVKHNKSHEESFKEWADKSKEMGKIEVAKNIEKAIEYMEQANEMLMEAKKHM
ncbi:MAG: hypothetical protein N4A48_10535 [Tepidibacter sp.]|jgi:propanediol dehydratase small subunit|uniref:hypothetical protein n=1 Tax=Tepidibacter sp. TaxID=2529387 RepID=UPI0025F03D49|nr:hypothetical protein [Tepidibacter sp.]MCT4509166.1 hypothetical protein [Tepidibacter sp.]